MGSNLVQGCEITRRRRGWRGDEVGTLGVVLSFLNGSAVRGGGGGGS